MGNILKSTGIATGITTLAIIGGLTVGQLQALPEDVRTVIIEDAERKVEQCEVNIGDWLERLPDASKENARDWNERIAECEQIIKEYNNLINQL